MEVWTITLVGLAAGLVLVIGGALVVYMGSLVKNAYQLKIEIKSDVEERQRRLEEEVEKKIRWIKRDLVEEVDKVKAAMQTDNERKFKEILDGVALRLTACEEALLTDRTQVGKAFEDLRADITTLDQRLRLVRRDQKAAQPAAADTAETPPTGAQAGFALPILSETAEDRVDDPVP